MKKVRILVADDHELVRRGVRALLRAHRVWHISGEAKTGQEAVDSATKLKPDVVILDISMPDDGLHAARQIREAVPSAEVLILTMHDSEQMVRRAFEAGARGYVLKSDLARDLVAGVKAVSEHRRFLTPNVSEVVLEGYLKSQSQGQETRPPPGRVTAREAEIIRLLAESKGNKGVAATLGITVRTVETHRANIMRKLGLHSMSELVRYAIRSKIVQP